MAVTIRPAEAADREAIFALHLSAFPTSAEARLVESLAADGEAMLSVVAAEGTDIIGHVMFSRMIASAGKRTLSAAALGPVAVTAARRYRGIGTALIDAGLAMLAESAVDYVFVLGEPDYYERFGFDPAIGDRFESPYAGPDWMGLALGEGVLPKRGEARHAPAFAAIVGHA